MNEKINLNEIQRKAFTSYHGDGLIDIVIGLFLLATIPYFFLDMFYLFGANIAIFLPIYIGIKQKLTIPRIGYVKFSTRGGPQLTILILTIFMAVMLLANVLLMIFFVPQFRTAIGLFLDNYYNLLIGGIAGGLTLLVAISTKIKRFYVYSGLTLGIFIAAHLFSINFIITIAIIGIFITTLGIITLIGFIKEYPIQSENNYENLN